ncbi:MAG TPA: C40 family peptidase [Clostridia bacterium]|nr:C40 family peptidase [Clostridia bacterium]
MNNNRLNYTLGLVLAGLAMSLAGCVNPSPQPTASGDALDRAQSLLQAEATRAEAHLRVFRLGVVPDGTGLLLTGEVDTVEARLNAAHLLRGLGVAVREHVIVLPTQEMGSNVWGIACLSVASAREGPEHKAEMGTQILMGGVVRVLKRNGIWYHVQAADGYLAWLEKGTFIRCTESQMHAWTNSALLLVTAMEDRILSRPDPEAEPVSDVVIANLVRRVAETPDWYEVELPDGRKGWLRKASAEEYASWIKCRDPKPENLERTARGFLGRPYLWGGNSPKGLDCSGFTKLVYGLNGIDLRRNAAHQARQGVEVPVSSFDQLKTGDLLFFGRRGFAGRPDRVTHVGIYLRDKLFIHSSERVQINSLDPGSTRRDERRISNLLYARRVLPEANPVSSAGVSPPDAHKSH